jgi:hypothetical protein
LRFIYVCNECQSFIGEIELQNWDETMLGFDTLTQGEKQELVSIDPYRQTGVVKAICDYCFKEKSGLLRFYQEPERNILQ